MIVLSGETACCPSDPVPITERAWMPEVASQTADFLEKRDKLRKMIDTLAEQTS